MQHVQHIKRVNRTGSLDRLRSWFSVPKLLLTIHFKKKLDLSGKIMNKVIIIIIVFISQRQLQEKIQWRETPGLDKNLTKTAFKSRGRAKKNEKIRWKTTDTDLRTQSKCLEVLNQVGEERKTLSLLKESLSS